MITYYPTLKQLVLRRLLEAKQYASKDFRDVLTEYGITSSMSRKGNCWDYACSETLFGSLKVERLHGQRFETRLWDTDSRGKVKPWS